MVRRGKAASVVAGTLLLLSGCGNGVQVTSGPAAATPTPRTTGSPTTTTSDATTGPTQDAPGSPDTSSPSGSGSATATASTTSTSASSISPSTPRHTPHPSPTPARAPTCTLADLHVGSAPTGDGRSAGSSYVLLTFTNHTQQRCSLHGFSGVSFVGGGNGTQLGAPARRISGYDVHRVELAPGKLVAELVQIIDPDVFAGDCTKTTADGFRVYPPGSFTAAYVPYPAPACVERNIKQLQIAPVGNAQ